MAISPLLSLQKKEYVPLDVDENEIKPLKAKDTRIHVGDPVKLG